MHGFRRFYLMPFFDQIMCFYSETLEKSKSGAKECARMPADPTNRGAGWTYT